MKIRRLTVSCLLLLLTLGLPSQVVIASDLPSTQVSALLQDMPDAAQNALRGERWGPARLRSLSTTETNRREWALTRGRGNHGETPPPPEEVVTNEVVVSGDIVALYPFVSGDPEIPARISLGYVADGSFTVCTFDIPASAELLLNGQPVVFTDLLVGDQVRIILTDNVVTRVEVTR